VWSERPEFADVLTILNLANAGIPIFVIGEELEIIFGGA
jgi:hypothetical protein